MNDHNKRFLLYTGVGLLAVLVLFLWVLERGMEREPRRPSPVVRTDEEAIARAKTFLSVAGINTSKFDTGKLESLSTGRSKDVKEWRVAWPAHDSEEKDDLVVLVLEDGRFCYYQKTEPNAGVYIEGLISNLTTGRFELSEAPNHTSDGIRHPADGLPKPSM